MEKFEYKIFGADKEEDNIDLAKDVFTAMNEVEFLEKRVRKLNRFIELHLSKVKKYLWRNKSGKYVFIPEIDDQYLLNLRTYLDNLETVMGCVDVDDAHDDRKDLIDDLINNRKLLTSGEEE